MLPELRKFDQKTRAGILAGLAQCYLPSPGLSKITTPQDVSPDIYDSLTKAIRKTLNIRSDDLSADAHRRIYSFLNAQLREAVLDTSKIKNVKERVGEKGILRNDLYTIKFHDIFKEKIEASGLFNKQQAERVILNPTQVQHLAPEFFDQKRTEGQSLFVATRNGEDPHSLMVIAVREKDTLNVICGWYIFHRDVDVTNVKTPEDLLRAFASKYGFELTILDKPKGKFLLYESFEYWATHPSLEQVLKVSNPGNQTEIGTISYKTLRAEGKIEVALAYAINVSAYATDLRGHGLKVRLPPTL